MTASLHTPDPATCENLEKEAVTSKQARGKKLGGQAGASVMKPLYAHVNWQQHLLQGPPQVKAWPLNSERQWSFTTGSVVLCLL